MTDSTLPQRKHPRLCYYDYSTPGYYFVTICTHEKRCIFGSPMHLNQLGRIADAAFGEISEHFPNVQVDKYVVMPNHVHAIIVLPPGTAGLSSIVGSYKSYVTKRIHAANPNMPVWQTSFHDHVIRSQQGYEKIWYYIDSNPLKWEDDCFYR